MQISALVPEIFKFEKCVKYANEVTDDVILDWVYDIIGNLICIFYTYSNLNIFETDADICKRLTAFLIFCGILCDITPTNSDSRGKS